MTAPRLTDKVIHAVVFGAPVIVGARAGLPLRWLVVAFAVHAPVSELIQHTVLPKRSGEVWDAVLDLAGVAAAAGIATALERRRAGASLAEAPPRTG